MALPLQRCGWLECAGFASDDLDRFEQHLATHANQRLASCRWTGCTASFASTHSGQVPPLEVMLHLRGRHSQFRPFPCPMCPKLFHAENLLAVHVDRIHKKRLNLFCCPRPDCHIATVDVTELMSHMKNTHQNRYMLHDVLKRRDFTTLLPNSPNPRQDIIRLRQVIVDFQNRMERRAIKSEPTELEDLQIDPNVSDKEFHVTANDDHTQQEDMPSTEPPEPSTFNNKLPQLGGLTEVQNTEHQSERESMADDPELSELTFDESTQRNVSGSARKAKDPDLVQQRTTIVQDALPTESTPEEMPTVAPIRVDRNGFEPENRTPEPVESPMKRKRGRPVGSKNKKKTKADAPSTATPTEPTNTTPKTKQTTEQLHTTPDEQFGVDSLFECASTTRVTIPNIDKPSTCESAVNIEVQKVNPGAPSVPERSLTLGSTNPTDKNKTDVKKTKTLIYQPDRYRSKTSSTKFCNSNQSAQPTAGPQLVHPHHVERGHRFSKSAGPLLNTVKKTNKVPAKPSKVSLLEKTKLMAKEGTAHANQKVISDAAQTRTNALHKENVNNPVEQRKDTIIRDFKIPKKSSSAAPLLQESQKSSQAKLKPVANKPKLLNRGWSTEECPLDKILPETPNEATKTSTNTFSSLQFTTPVSPEQPEPSNRTPLPCPVPTNCPDKEADQVGPVKPPAQSASSEDTSLNQSSPTTPDCSRADSSSHWLVSSRSPLSSGLQSSADTSPTLSLTLHNDVPGQCAPEPCPSAAGQTKVDAPAVCLLPCLWAHCKTHFKHLAQLRHHWSRSHVFEKRCSFEVRSGELCKELLWNDRARCLDHFRRHCKAVGFHLCRRADCGQRLESSALKTEHEKVCNGRHQEPKPPIQLCQVKDRFTSIQYELQIDHTKSAHRPLNIPLQILWERVEDCLILDPRLAKLTVDPPNKNTAVSSEPTNVTEVTPLAKPYEPDVDIPANITAGDTMFSESDYSDPEVSPTQTASEASPIEGVTEVSPPEKSTEVSPVEKATEVSPTEKTPEVSPVEKTPEVSPVEKTPEVSPVEKTPEVSQTEKATEVSQTEKATEVSPTEKTPEVSPVEKTPEVSSTEKATKVSPTVKATEVSPSQNPGLNTASEAKKLETVPKSASKESRRIEIGTTINGFVLQDQCDTDSEEESFEEIDMPEADLSLMNSIKVDVDVHNQTIWTQIRNSARDRSDSESDTGHVRSSRAFDRRSRTSLHGFDVCSSPSSNASSRNRSQSKSPSPAPCRPNTPQVRAPIRGPRLTPPPIEEDVSSDKSVDPKFNNLTNEKRERRSSEKENPRRVVDDDEYDTEEEFEKAFNENRLLYEYQPRGKSPFVYFRNPNEVPCSRHAVFVAKLNSHIYSQVRRIVDDIGPNVVTHVRPSVSFVVRYSNVDHAKICIQKLMNFNGHYILALPHRDRPKCSSYFRRRLSSNDRMSVIATHDEAQEPGRLKLGCRRQCSQRPWGASSVDEIPTKKARKDDKPAKDSKDWAESAKSSTNVEKEDADDEIVETLKQNKVEVATSLRSRMDGSTKLVFYKCKWTGCPRREVRFAMFHDLRVHVQRVHGSETKCRWGLCYSDLSKGNAFSHLTNHLDFYKELSEMKQN